MTLRTRLILGFVVVLLIVASGAFVLVRTQRAYLIGQVDDQLESARPAALRSPAGPPRNDGEDRPPPTEAPISELFIGHIEDGELVTGLQGQLLDDTPDLDTDAGAVGEVENGDPFTVEGVNRASRFRAIVVRPPDADVAAVIALPLAEVDSTVSRLTLTLGLAVAVVAGVLGLILWWVERHGLRPVARLTAAADAIAGGDRTHRVLGADPRTEAGKLANAFNVMLDERDASEDRLRRFVADASHELRTPLTSLRGYLDLYGQGGFRGAYELDDVVRRMSQESSRMNDLVEDLLLLANLDQHRPLRNERVDLGQLLRDAATDARVLQPDRPVAVEILGTEPLETTGDLFRLQQVIGTLVTNALIHTDTSAELRLTARASGDGFLLTVADTGPGLEPDVAARVFDRFFRGEQSRSRRSGGSGLGLAIAKSIVEAHGGTITLESAPGSGCRFAITLPHRAAADPATPEMRGS